MPISRGIEMDITEEQNIKIYSVLGQYEYADKDSFFELEVEVVGDLAPFGSVRHSHANIIDIPLRGFIYTDSIKLRKKRLILHNDIADTGELSLFYNLTCSKSLEGMFEGYVAAVNTEFIYHTLKKIFLGEDLSQITPSFEKFIEEHIKTPVYGVISKIYEL